MRMRKRLTELLPAFRTAGVEVAAEMRVGNPAAENLK